jgi:ABC-type multidrug transport system ATPase subunit
MLELVAIDAGYGSFQALLGVSLEIRLGEAVAVIGPDGAGKTTLMRVISGLIRPTRGRIYSGRLGSDQKDEHHRRPRDPRGIARCRSIGDAPYARLD